MTAAIAAAAVNLAAAAAAEATPAALGCWNTRPGAYIHTLSIRSAVCSNPEVAIVLYGVY